MGAEGAVGMWRAGQVFGFYSRFSGKPLGPCKQENGVISLIFSSTVILGVGLMEKVRLGRLVRRLLQGSRQEAVVGRQSQPVCQLLRWHLWLQYTGLPTRLQK